MIHDRRPDDNVEEESGASPASRRLDFILSSEDAAVLEDRRPDDAVEEEERVDFDSGADDLDLSGSAQPTSSEVPSHDREPDDQVPTSDPYCFD